MASTLIQFRYDENNRIKALDICEKLGIDITTYLKMALNRLIRDNGIPFSMTLDEINTEIDEARKYCKQKD